VTTERILVIGGTGSIGTHVTRVLAAAGHETAVYTRGCRQSRLPSHVRRFTAPGLTLPLLQYPEALLRWDPTVVVHMICMGEPDAAACAASFSTRVGRCVLVSSGDVYAAFGRFLRLESGPPDPDAQNEDAPLRRVLFPYRGSGASESLHHWYEKQLAERVVMSGTWEWSILRLAKVYGPEVNADLATVYGHASYPNWRWTHVFSENAGSAIAQAALHPAAARRIYNVGEPVTPTMGERLARLPHRHVALDDGAHDFSHSIVLDTRRIRDELGYTDVVPEEEAMLSLRAEPLPDRWMPRAEPGRGMPRRRP
jgi:nucleoside-diphosphate-sugar epimerase